MFSIAESHISLYCAILFFFLFCFNNLCIEKLDMPVRGLKHVCREAQQSTTPSEGGGVLLATPSVQSHLFAFTAVMGMLLWHVSNTRGQFFLPCHGNFCNAVWSEWTGFSSRSETSSLTVSRSCNSPRGLRCEFWLGLILPLFSFLCFSHFVHCI